MRTIICTKCGSNELVDTSSGRVCAFCRAQFVEDPVISISKQDILGHACARCGLVDRVVLYGARKTTQENAARIYLGRLESSVPRALSGDPIRSDFDSKLHLLDAVMACERCACLSLDGVETQPEELCESVFGSFGMLRMYEHRTIGGSLYHAQFGTSIDRREFECADIEIVDRRFYSLVDRVPFNSKEGTIERYRKRHGSTTVSVVCGQTGSQWKAQNLGGLRKASWWPTVTLLSAMWSEDSDLGLISMISGSSFSNTAAVSWGISSGYKKKFEELSGLLDEPTS